MKSNKLKLPDGSVVIRCEECGRWRHHTAFLVGEKDWRKNECWNPVCAYCRNKGPYCQETREAIGMPDDAKWDDIAGSCYCGDGRFKSDGRNGICFRCQGKAELSWKDMARNFHFDRLQAMRGFQQDKEPEPEKEETTVVTQEDDEEDFLSFMDQ